MCKCDGRSLLAAIQRQDSNQLVEGTTQEVSFGLKMVTNWKNVWVGRVPASGPWGKAGLVALQVCLGNRLKVEKEPLLTRVLCGTMVARLLVQRGGAGRAPPFDQEASHKGMASQQSKDEEMVMELESMVGVLVLMGLHTMLLVGEW